MSEQWSTEHAAAWYAGIPPIRGFNYLPRTAINSTEMWQDSSFDEATIAQELGWAQAAGYNSARVFVQFLVWQADPQGLIQRFGRFLEIASQQGITTMPVLFDDCAFSGREPYLGAQQDPVPGVHNSGWTASPGRSRVIDQSGWDALREYIVSVISAYAGDERVIAWDLYNEPGNAKMGELSLPLVDAVFRWARAANPAQPLTAGAWVWDAQLQTDVIGRRLCELSDVISFHYYKPDGLNEAIATCAAYQRPLICTEWLHRRYGQTPEVALPVFARHHVGWYHWGLVAGRTQTYLDWTSKAGDPPPDVWQHDVFHPDGSPYSVDDLAQIGAFRFN